MSDKKLKFLIIAGEASGDLHGANLVRAMQKINPNIEFIGTGGESMSAAGVKLRYNVSELAVMGFVEVMRHIFFFREVFANLKQALYYNKIDGVILIDYPGLNLRIAKIAHSLKIPVFYYISPQIWAWKKGRLKLLERYITKLFYILPFEKKVFENSKVNSRYVGHPLVKIVKPIYKNKSEFFKKLRFKKNKFTIGLFPGSRKQEIKKILPTVLNALHKLYTDYPFQLILNYSSHTDIQFLRKFFTEYYPFDYKIVTGYNYDTMYFSDLLLVTSGTATLEAALSLTPFIIMYKTNIITYLLAKLLVDVKFIGLANLIAEKKIVPELIQFDLNEEKLMNTIIEVSKIQRYYQIKEELRNIRYKLGEYDTNEIIASDILQYYSQ